MSTSLLYHAWGIHGYRHQATHFVEGHVFFWIAQPRERLRCSACGTEHVRAQGTTPRFLRTLPSGGKPGVVCLPVPRVRCLLCDHVRQVTIPFAEPRRHYTRACARSALELSQHLTIQDVARHLQVGWDTIKDIQARSLQRRFGKPKLKNLQQIAIAEIAIGKGHRYLTVVLNLLTGAVVVVGDGKGVAALQPFWRRLRAARAKIKAVATDMSKAYVKAVRDNLPGVVHVFDHVHVVKLFNDKLSAFRRELYHQASPDRARKILKGTRWLLVKNPENLDTDRNE